MRNLKKSYRNLLDNNKRTSTGRGRITWEWYNNMEEIFREDRTVHIGPTLSSMPTENNTVNENFCALTTSTCNDQSTSRSACSEMEVPEPFTENEQLERCVKILVQGNSYISDWLKSCAQLNFGVVSYDVYDEDEWHKDSIKTVILRQQSVSDSTTLSDSSTSHQPEMRIRKQKAAKSKAMYEFRNKFLCSEEKRVEAINKLTAAIEQHNNIQLQRNDILQKLISSIRKED